MAWKFKYEKAEQEKLYAQTHQKTVEVAVEKKVPYEKCDKCDRTAYQKAKENMKDVYYFESNQEVIARLDAITVKAS